MCMRYKVFIHIDIVRDQYDPMWPFQDASNKIPKLGAP